VSAERPPREQKLPLASGTLKFETLNGFASAVTSAIHTLWRVSRHSFTICSLTIITKSPMALRHLGKFGVAASEAAQRRVRAVGGLQVEPAHLRIEQVFVVGSLGPFRSFSRSTICSTPSCWCRSRSRCGSYRAGRDRAVSSAGTGPVAPAGGGQAEVAMNTDWPGRRGPNLGHAPVRQSGRPTTR